MKFEMKPEVDGFDNIAVDLFKRLDVSEEKLNLLYAAYANINPKNSAVVRIDELFEYFELSQSAFNQRLFASFNVSTPGYLNFCEFVGHMWHILSLDPLSDQFNRIIYDLYGPEDGIITAKKLHSLLAGIHHNSNVRVSSMSAKFFAEGLCGEISFQVFCLVVTSSPEILAPVVRMQLTLRVQLLGVAHWEIVSKIRDSKDGCFSIQNHAALMAKYITVLRDKQVKRVADKATKEDGRRAGTEVYKSKSTQDRDINKKSISAIFEYSTRNWKTNWLPSPHSGGEKISHRDPTPERTCCCSHRSSSVMGFSKMSRVCPDIDDSVRLFNVDD